MLVCSFGVVLSMFNVLLKNKMMISNMVVVNIMDNVFNVNILFFGVCSSMVNLIVVVVMVLVIVVVMGVFMLMFMFCVFVFFVLWVLGVLMVMLVNLLVLNNILMLNCVYVGVVIISMLG